MRGFGFRQTEAFGCQMIKGGQEEHNSDLLWGFSRFDDCGVKDSAFVACFLCVMGHVGKNCTLPLLRCYTTQLLPSPAFKPCARTPLPTIPFKTE